MKRCPECRRDYTDDTLSFCLEDGTPLVQGSVPVNRADSDEPATAILHSTDAVGEAPTRAQIHTTERTADLPSGIADVPQRGFDKRLIAAPILVVVIALGVYLGYRSFSTTTTQIESIAVMPFVNESGNPDVEFLSDGMTETLIGSLSQIPNLNIKARSSVFRYKGTETDAKTIGRELNVQAVLFGKVIKRGDQLTLSLELVDAATENAIWSQRYDRKQSDLVSLQGEIARDVTSKLKSKLSGADAARVERSYTANPEAYQLYLQGRFAWNKRNGEEFEKAIALFKQAIEKDPNYAQAYSGLADTYALMPNFDHRPKEYMPQAKQAALKSIQLDDELAEGHASLGQILLYYDYDFAGADKAFRRAIELDPKYATAYQWYAEVFLFQGKFDEGLSKISKALELDPFSKIINKNMGDDLYYARKYDEAAVQYTKSNELFPDVRSLHSNLMYVYAAQGKYDQAGQEYLNTFRTMKGISPDVVKQYEDAHAKGGFEGLVRHTIESDLERDRQTLEKDKDAYLDSTFTTINYAFLKDKDNTLKYLSKMFGDRISMVLFLKVDPLFDFLQDDQRFIELYRKAGLTE